MGIETPKVAVFSLLPEDIDVMNPEYEGLLGIGYISAEQAVKKDKPTKIIKDFGKIFVPVTDRGYKVNLEEYFTDVDGHRISYTATSLDPKIALASVSGLAGGTYALKVKKLIFPHL